MKKIIIYCRVSDDKQAVVDVDSTNKLTPEEKFMRSITSSITKFKSDFKREWASKKGSECSHK